jgi:hypothetical protein
MTGTVLSPVVTTTKGHVFDQNEDPRATGDTVHMLLPGAARTGTHRSSGNAGIRHAVET